MSGFALGVNDMSTHASTPIATAQGRYKDLVAIKTPGSNCACRRSIDDIFITSGNSARPGWPVDEQPDPSAGPAWTARDQGAHRASDRHRRCRHVHRREAVAAGGAVFGRWSCSGIDGRDESVVAMTARQASSWRLLRSDPRVRRLRVARRASDALRPDLPDRDAGRPEHRTDQLGDVRARQQDARREPYRKVALAA